MKIFMVRLSRFWLTSGTGCISQCRGKLAPELLITWNFPSSKNWSRVTIPTRQAISSFARGRSALRPTNSKMKQSNKSATDPRVSCVSQINVAATLLISANDKAYTR